MKLENIKNLYLQNHLNIVLDLFSLKQATVKIDNFFFRDQHFWYYLFAYIVAVRCEYRYSDIPR